MSQTPETVNDILRSALVQMGAETLDTTAITVVAHRTSENGSRRAQAPVTLCAETGRPGTVSAGILSR